MLCLGHIFLIAQLVLSTEVKTKGGAKVFIVDSTNHVTYKLFTKYDMICQQMKNAIIIKVGQNHTIIELIKRLIKMGYDRVENIKNPGEFSVSGGTFLLFSVFDQYPIKLDYFGNLIERIIKFDLINGKTIAQCEKVRIDVNRLELNDKTKISKGDYVVHEDHGIGLFSNFCTKKIDNKLQLYAVLEYLNNDVLYLPIEQKDKITLYLGVGRKKPKLNKLGTQTWSKNYKKTYDNILLLAKELLLIYAKRELVKSVPWKIHNDWKSEIQKTFGYRTTKDQESAINSVFLDLQKEHPMDRLICGDVGFGKTEVAIHASAQAMANNYQVAVLVPTTILAEQHFFTFKKRFSNLPVTIEKLSRFVDKNEQKRVIYNLKNGKTDIVIGTHKLFSQSVEFKNIGLLVIDEEQKFGVKEKERLKKLRTNINIMSLTATPIPRTLFMALSGIRDLSQISSPPIGRKEITTIVTKYDERLISKYVRLEIKRGGQVYYLHNQVATIEGTRNKMMKLFPELRIEVVHGQQTEKKLAQTMSEFTQGKIDLLVCSTIIESGLDLPNVNTLIVEESDKFGLSQLYQIRGRIGRSKKQAFAIFTHRDKQITANAHKRLKALMDYTELGSGYSIAFSDLEIRGGGNVLGREQHGNMESIGLVLYSKLLNQVVKKIKDKSFNNDFFNIY